VRNERRWRVKKWLRVSKTELEKNGKKEAPLMVTTAARKYWTIIKQK